MMNWKQLFNLKGTNLWLVAVGVGWNVLWAFFMFTVTLLVLNAGAETSPILQVAVLIAAYLGPFLGGWFLGRIAGDNRGPTYGAVGSLSGVILILITLLPSGVLGLMAAVVALLGGLNGGVLSQHRR